MSLQLTSRQSSSTVSGPALAALPCVVLTWRERQRSRLPIVMDNGQAAVILLPRGTTLANGDVLASDTGEKVLIRAAAESLLEITADTPFQLLRLVYHLANRHVSAMLTTHAIYIESDPVLADMVERLGGAIKLTEQPFEPEKGAYHGASTHAPSHSHHGAMAPSGDGHGHSHVGSHLHSHGHGHGGVDDIDRKMGNIGEELSRQAHDKS